MTRYFTQKISIEKLAEKILDAWKKHEFFGDNDDSCGINLEDKVKAATNYRTGILYTDLTPRIRKDLSKIDFDTENISAEEAYGFGIDACTGLRTLENGLAFLGINAGGDWEYPIFFILYHDGKELRGYIPKKGNTWNPVNKSAFGNDEQADKIGLRRRGLSSMDKLKFDAEKIIRDITERIIYGGKNEIANWKTC